MAYALGVGKARREDHLKIGFDALTEQGPIAVGRFNQSHAYRDSTAQARQGE